MTVFPSWPVPEPAISSSTVLEEITGSSPVMTDKQQF